jgi:hypothetical protein
MVDLLDIKEAYAEGVMFLEKFFGITLSVAAAETISNESSMWYEGYYDSRDTSSPSEKAGDLTAC